MMSTSGVEYFSCPGKLLIRTPIQLVESDGLGVGPSGPPPLLSINEEMSGVLG